MQLLRGEPRAGDRGGGPAPGGPCQGDTFSYVQRQCLKNEVVLRAPEQDLVEVVQLHKNLRDFLNFLIMK